jgi:hypothetical protein
MKRALAIASVMFAACLCGAWTARTTIPAALVATQSAGEAEPTEPAYWEITVETATSPQDFLWNLQAGSGINLNVDYGVGAGAVNYVSTGIKTNTYATAGTYPVRFSGGAASALSIRFGASSGLTPTLVTATKAVGGVSNIVNFTETFRRTALASVPSDLFRWQTALSGEAFIATFAQTTFQALPSTLFAYAAGLSGDVFDRTFYLGGITNVPAGLFDRATLVGGSLGKGFKQTFDGCANLETIPANLMASNTVVRSYYAMFNNCPKLQVRADIFGPDLQAHFAGRTLSISFASMFFRFGAFGGAQGTAPALWSVTNVSFTSTSTFTGHGTNSLSNWTSIPTAWGGPAE